MSEQSMSVSQSDLVVVHSDEYANWVFDPTHPTQGRRFINGLEAIKERMKDFRIIAPRRATWEELALVHSDEYIAEVLKEARCGEWVGVRKDLSDLAQQFAGGTLVALEELLSGRAKVAVHLPGAKHHAQRDHASGFCVFADFAMAAKVAVSRGLKVAIFDFDAHHGDGTENLCADDPNILTYSVHEEGIFPGTGLYSLPRKHVYNRPIRTMGNRRQKDDLLADSWQSEGFDEDLLVCGTEDEEQLVFAAGEFGRLAAEFGADIIFIAAGADGHRDDPLSNLTYSPGGLIKVFGNLFYGWAPKDVPVLIGGAGGYRPDDATPEMWASTVEWVANFNGCRW